MVTGELMDAERTADEMLDAMIAQAQVQQTYRDQPQRVPMMTPAGQDQRALHQGHSGQGGQLWQMVAPFAVENISLVLQMMQRLLEDHAEMINNNETLLYGLGVPTGKNGLLGPLPGGRRLSTVIQIHKNAYQERWNERVPGHPFSSEADRINLVRWDAKTRQGLRHLPAKVMSPIPEDEMDRDLFEDDHERSQRLRWEFDDTFNSDTFGMCPCQNNNAWIQ